MGEFKLSRIDLAGVETILAEGTSPYPLLMDRDDRQDRAGNFRRSGVRFVVTDADGAVVEWDQ